jgi:ubiquinone/menaquinone biosynthesis C-methylase UbiE
MAAFKSPSRAPEAIARKQALRGVFDRAAATYGSVRYFPLLGQWLVEMAQITRGAHVLDVACGQGAVLVPAAQRVGPEGSVIGIDLSEGMVQQAASLLDHLGLTQAEARPMDAEHLEFPDATFDFVVCGFSFQFFPHLEQALSEARRVLKPAGQIVATTWADRDPRWKWYDDLRNAHQATVKLTSWSLDRREELLDWFGRAGFVNIRIASRELDMVYADEDEWWARQWSISGRAGLERLEPGRLEALKAEVFARIHALKQADGLHERLRAHCTIAFKP